MASLAAVTGAAILPRSDSYKSAMICGFATWRQCFCHQCVTEDPAGLGRVRNREPPPGETRHLVVLQVRHHLSPV